MVNTDRMTAEMIKELAFSEIVCFAFISVNQTPALFTMYAERPFNIRDIRGIIHIA